MSTRYFEHLDPGESHDVGPRTVTDADIVAFAERYDPQPFHVDREAAEESVFGGLAASGWHTAAVTMRLLVDGVFGDVAVAGALGVDDLRWHRPVYGGDELRVTATVVDVEGWGREKGEVRFGVETADGDGDVVHSRTDLVLVHRAP